jgi:serine/threonine-protein phosphatase 4 regulatory subunit 1
VFLVYLLGSPSWLSFRFIACQQALVVPGVDGNPATAIDDSFWKDLNLLVLDEIIGVRISLARFIRILRGMYIKLASMINFTSDALILAQFLRQSHSVVPHRLGNLMRHLAVDVSQEVRAFVPGDEGVHHRSVSSTRISGSVSIFSRPPPLEVSS